jgi:poly(3-hydroxybutyrate) depolymerase
MAKHLFLLFSFSLFANFVTGQYCTNDNRFTEQYFFSDNEVRTDTGIVYGNAVNWLGQNEVLSMNIHFPKNAVDTMAKRPLIVMIHGGGFVGGAKEDLDETCRLFAKRGYVAATIRYRLGRSCANDSLSYLKAVYRANQDTRAAIRFLVNGASTLRIDTSWIFIGGGSAGAGTSLGLVYLSQAEWDADFPLVSSSLGSLDNSGNNLTDAYTIKGIFNNWGAIGKDYMQQAELLPMISFHGDQDPTVNIDSAQDVNCLTQSPVMYGSRSLHYKLIGLGICSDLTVEVGGDHGIYNSTQSQVDFRVGRAACFFKSVFCNTCTNFYAEDSIAAFCSQTINSINNIASNAEIEVYPNPTTGLLNVNVGGNDKINEIKVFNLLGEEVLSVNGVSQINLNSLKQGIYILYARLNQRTFTKRIAKVDN